MKFDDIFKKETNEEIQSVLSIEFQKTGKTDGKDNGGVYRSKHYDVYFKNETDNFNDYKPMQLNFAYIYMYFLLRNLGLGPKVNFTLDKATGKLTTYTKGIKDFTEYTYIDKDNPESEQMKIAMTFLKIFNMSDVMMCNTNMGFKVKNNEIKYRIFDFLIPSEKDRNMSNNIFKDLALKNAVFLQADEIVKYCKNKETTLAEVMNKTTEQLKDFLAQPRIIGATNVNTLEEQTKQFNIYFNEIERDYQTLYSKPLQLKRIPNDFAQTIYNIDVQKNIVSTLLDTNNFNNQDDGWEGFDIPEEGSANKVPITNKTLQSKPKEFTASRNRFDEVLMPTEFTASKNRFMRG
jgi:hypothetical protein